MRALLVLLLLTGTAEAATKFEGCQKQTSGRYITSGLPRPHHVLAPGQMNGYAELHERIYKRRMPRDVDNVIVVWSKEWSGIVLVGEGERCFQSAKYHDGTAEIVRTLWREFE